MLDSIRYKVALFIAPALSKVVETRAQKLIPRTLLNSYQCKFHGHTEQSDDGISDSERKEYELWGKMNVNNPWFRHFIRWSVDSQANFAIRHAQNERQADFARATINAFELLEDEVERLSKNWEERNKPAEDYDEFSTGISDNIS